MNGMTINVNQHCGSYPGKSYTWSAFFLPVTPFCWANVSLISIYIPSWAFSAATIKEIDSASPRLYTLQLECAIQLSQTVGKSIATFHPIVLSKLSDESVLIRYMT